VAEGAGDDGAPATGVKPGETAAHANPRKASFGDFLAELKRRRVFRVMVGYGIFAFAVLQVIEPVMHAYDLPNWLLTAVVSALAMGFPVAVVLSWIFDLTAAGVRRTPASAGPRAITLSRGRLAALLAGVGILAALPGIAWYAWRHGHQQKGPEASGASIAVLPFADLSPGHDQDYFSDGVAEEILWALSKVEGLRVPGRASSFWFKGKNVEPVEVARKLGVAHLLEGSVRRSGNKLRITAEVVKVENGERLWFQAFDRELTEVFAIQDEISRAVVEALRPVLLGSATAPSVGRPTNDSEAYRLMLLGRALNVQLTEDSLRRAVAALEHAVEIDPALAQAHAWLGAAAYNLAGLTRGVERKDLERRGKEAADRAVALAPDLPMALSTRGLWRMGHDWDWDGARADLERAVLLGPNESPALNNLAIFRGVVGDIDDALKLERKAVNLDPLAANRIKNLSEFLLRGGHEAEAREQARRALEISPQSQAALEVLAEADLLAGRPEDALEAYSRLGGPFRLMGVAVASFSAGKLEQSRAALETLEQDHADRPYRIARVHAWMGTRNQALEWLERAYRMRDSGDRGIMKVKSDPLLRSLHGDPRYEALLQTMKLTAH
jgi:serine/threonine-protein kinase